MPVLAENKEVVAPQLAIIIEDEEKLAQIWPEKFQHPELEYVLAPQSGSQLVDFISDISSADLSRTSLVVIDQGYAARSVSYFLKRLGAVNTHALIIETSALATTTLYKESDGYLSEDRVSVVSLANNTAGNLNAKLSKLRFYASPEAREAQKCDEHSEWYESKTSRPFRLFKSDVSFKKLIDHVHTLTISDSLGIAHYQFSSYFYDCPNKEAKTEYLHLSWNILLMKASGNTIQEISDSMTVSRLKELLKSLE